MSKVKSPKGMQSLPLTRRHFVQGLAAAAAIAALESGADRLFGETVHRTPVTLTGNHFDLTIDYLSVNFTGKRRLATAVNGSVPGPTLRWREGDTVTLAVTNRLKQMTSIHWHAIRLPSGMDGVPGLSFPESSRTRPSSTKYRWSRAAPTGITAIAGSRNRPG
jgi:FtsP/CotA-like multicopper oxidase with cupredoxin domain